MECQPAHHGQPQLPEHGPSLSDRHHRVRSSDEPDSQGGFFQTGSAVAHAAAAVIKGLTSAQIQPGAESWAQAYVAGGELTEEITRLKATDGKPIVAHGGAAFARSLIARNLVDEYVLLVYPIALGRGVPIFSDLPAPRSLRLVRSRAFPLGAVAQIYRPA